MCHGTFEASPSTDLGIFTPGSSTYLHVVTHRVAQHLGQVEDPIDTLLQGPRFEPGTHNGIRRLTVDVVQISIELLYI